MNVMIVNGNVDNGWFKYWLSDEGFGLSDEGFGLSDEGFGLSDEGFGFCE